MSLTTIFAPWAAICSAMSRPMPRPDPVTTATLPCSIVPLFMRENSFGMEWERRATGQLVSRSTLVARMLRWISLLPP